MYCFLCWLAVPFFHLWGVNFNLLKMVLLFVLLYVLFYWNKFYLRYNANANSKNFDMRWS